MTTSVKLKAYYVILYVKQPSCICSMNSRGCSTQDGLQHNRIMHWYREFKEARVYIIRVSAGRPWASGLSVRYRKFQNKAHWNCCDGCSMRCRYHTATVSILAAVPRHVLNWMTSELTLCTHYTYVLHTKSCILLCVGVLLSNLSLFCFQQHWTKVRVSIHVLHISQWSLCQLFFHINFPFRINSNGTHVLIS